MRLVDCPMLSDPVLAPGGQGRLRRRSGDGVWRTERQWKQPVTFRARDLGALLAAASAKSLIRHAMQSAREGGRAC